MHRLGLAAPTESWTGTLEYYEAPALLTPILSASPSPSPPPPQQTPQSNITVGSLVTRVPGASAEASSAVGQVERIEGSKCWVKWAPNEPAVESNLDTLLLHNVPSNFTPSVSANAESKVQPTPAVPKSIFDRRKLVLEPAKFGQRVLLGVVLWLDFRNTGKVTGSLEFCDFRARVRIEGEWKAQESTLVIEEKELISGRNTDWTCRFGTETFCPGTRYELRLDLSREEMSCEFFHPVNSSEPQPQIEERDKSKAIGSLKLQRRRLFFLSADAHGSSLIVPKDDRTSVRLSPLGGESSLSGLALAEVGFSRGVHYWEIKVDSADDHGTIFCGAVERPPGPIYPVGVPVPNLNRWEKVSAAWGFVSFRATLWMTASSSTGGTEQIYGEFFETGDTVGVLLDLDAGEISFFIDALKFGEHIMRDLGPAFFPHQLAARVPIKWNPTSEAQVLYPAIGLKRCAGDAVSVSSKYISFPSTEPQEELYNMSHLSALLRGHFRGADDDSTSLDERVLETHHQSRQPLPTWFVSMAYAHYLRWSENRFRYVASRAGGRVVEVDTAPEAMAAACALGGVDPPFRVGEKVKTLQSQGRELSTPENAVVLGARMNRVWYSIVTVSTHEGFGDGATWAFYWEPEELPMLMRDDDTDTKEDHQKEKASCILSKEEFSVKACGVDWSRPMDYELVRLVNFILQHQGEQDAMNLDFGRDYSIPAFSNQTTRSESEIKARIAVLRLFNSMVKRALPFMSSPSSPGRTPMTGIGHPDKSLPNGFASLCHRSRRFIFTVTKRTYWEAVLKSTTTGTTLSSEEYVDPPQIRTVIVNRIKATPARLATISSESKRMKRSVFGQLYAEMMKWPDHSFRRAYCGKGHGGQKRAFKLKLVGEGVDDYGGPYRQAFEVVCDELQNDTEWPDSKRRACLLPLFIPCPNRYSAVGDVGRDKFTLNPMARSPSLLRRFEFLGKLMGTAVRHGLQLGLDLPQLFWRKLVGLPVTRKHLEEMDVSFVRDLRVLESASKETFNDVVGSDRKFQVVLSDGTVVGGEDAPAVTAENVLEYVRFALQMRLQESDMQMDALKKGLSAVLPLEHLALFTAEELETMVCGRRELDVELLKSVTEYEGVSPTDPHVQWFWQVLDEMTPEDRTAFLKFVWARSRMPSKAEMSTAFHLQQPSGGAAERPDEFLPSAQTCFFSLALPKYSSKELLKTKFLKAIECTLMDADVRLRSAEGWAEV